MLKVKRMLGWLGARMHCTLQDCTDCTSQRLGLGSFTIWDACNVMSVCLETEVSMYLKHTRCFVLILEISCLIPACFSTFKKVNSKKECFDVETQFGHWSFKRGITKENAGHSLLYRSSQQGSAGSITSAVWSRLLLLFLLLLLLCPVSLGNCPAN